MDPRDDLIEDNIMEVTDLHDYVWDSQDKFALIHTM